MSITPKCLPRLVTQVQQRGIEATKSILMQLLNGMGSGNSKDPVLVVDLLPSRHDLDMLNMI